MINRVLSEKSRQKLVGVHPDLRSVVERALPISAIDFCIGEGLRTLDRQRELLKQGKTQTLSSRHLTGHAVDLYALVNGIIDWHFPLYEKINIAMQLAADDLRIPIVWGGNWKTLKDGVHFELPRDKYPDYGRL